MCGIAGIFNYAAPERPLDKALLRAMTSSLSHRGPDADGVFVEGPIGLGHRRLSIVDLSPTGAQPMVAPDGRACIAYNGEFYNHQEYRSQLEARGVRFRGPSDTETLLHVMRELGPDSLEDASGIFGFAYWDSVQQTLTLVRDPLGVKQVYFHDDGERILFASEIKALLCDPSVKREMDPLAVSEYLHFHTPLFERTFFKGIRQLRAGQWIRFGKSRVQTRQYWTLDRFDKSAAGVGEQVQQLKERLSSVVTGQLMADVPITAFFSGGIDSTAVAAFASKAGRLSEVFGVHFADQGVIDERPFQEQAAKALGLKLNLSTLDGASFDVDIESLLYFQDQPVIGPAMLPMHAVSKQAAERFKVCLGGQASDEVFGGYARYALARPWAVARNSFAMAGGGAQLVGGNLSKQLAQRNNIRRLAGTLCNLGDWQTRYFENFAKVPVSAWESVFAIPEVRDREHCRRTFLDETALSRASDPTDKLQEWDLRTYLTGLFQQDDRMSMSVGLESRVPLADPRLVRHAFRIPFDLKMRRGASKWILRQAIADLVPEPVLNRTKVGFDTPVHAWMANQHSAFVRDILLSSRARQRGIWTTAGVSRLLEHPGSAYWADLTWKILNIEMWARIFLDRRAPEPAIREATYRVRTSAPVAALPETPHQAEGRWAPNLVREVQELGLGRTAARLSWEVRSRAMLTGRRTPVSDQVNIRSRLLFTDPRVVGQIVPSLLGAQQRDELERQGREAAFGRLTAFGHWQADFGYPIAWHKNPVNGRAFRRTSHWSRSYAEQSYVGDIKLAWEAGRFPQCFTLGRAATANPEVALELGKAMRDQIVDFIGNNPVNSGVQWCNGQEVAFRLLAWAFALEVFPSPESDWADLIGRSIVESTHYIEDHIEYAQHSVYNNHLISEAFGLMLGGMLAPQYARSKQWTSTGCKILTEEADRQFYRDGAYISQSHNYHRSVLQVYLAAARLLQNAGVEIPNAWMQALDRSLDFLIAQQNPCDGRLPNYGGNDGAMPLILSACDYADFRPTLQAVSALTRRELVYEHGLWDEMPLWLWGPDALQLPRRAPRSKSVSFSDTGYHVLRGHQDGSFATFRCGSLKDRFSQIDMLHMDLWWRGHNVLVDTGSFLYNGPSEWHSYFYGVGGHNTLRVNGENQMPHIRKFKCLYPTRAELKTLRSEARPSADGKAMSVLSGEHFGYVRSFGVTHRRTILFDGSETWVVVDDLLGTGSQRVEAFWHGGEFPYRVQANGISIETPAGDFHVCVFTGDGQPLDVDVAFGEENPPAGWVSRYYASMQPIPRITAMQHRGLPMRFVSILSPHLVESVTEANGVTRIRLADSREVSFPSKNVDEAVISEPPRDREPTEKELVRSS